MSVQATKGDFLEGIASYTATTDGTSVLFSACSQAAQYAQRLPGMSAAQIAYAKHAQNTFSTAGDALVLADFVTNLGEFRNGQAQLAALEPSQTEKIEKVKRKMLVDGIQIGAFACDASKFLHSSELINIGRAFPVAGVGFNTGFLVTNTIEGVDAVRDMQKNQADLAKASTDAQRSTLLEKIYLARLKIAKFITHNVVCAMSIAGICFASAVQGIALFPITFLIFSTLYIASKIAIHLQQRKLSS